MNRIVNGLLFVTAMFIFAAGCESNEHHHDSAKAMSTAGEMAVAELKPSKAATTQPTNNDVTGTVTFTQADDGVHVVAHVMGLSPGQHGFHIHEKGDLSDPGLQSVGPHYNPAHSHHGGPATPEHHAGDFGNLTADASGHATLEMTFKGVKLSDVVNRSVIVHAGSDDLKTDPAGNSGARVAGGVIEMKK